MIFTADTTLAYLWYKINMLSRFFTASINSVLCQVHINRAKWLLLSSSGTFYVTFAIIMAIITTQVDISTSVLVCDILGIIANVVALWANIYSGRKLIRFIFQRFGEKPTLVFRVMTLICSIIALRVINGIILLSLNPLLLDTEKHETIGWTFIVLAHYLILEIFPVLVILVNL